MYRTQDHCCKSHISLWLLKVLLRSFQFLVAVQQIMCLISLIHTFSQLSHFKISMESQAEMSRCQSKVIIFRKITGSSQQLHTSYSPFVITQNGTQEQHA